jgi:thioesterase domain-containing protein
MSFIHLGFDSVGMASLINKLIALLDENISPSIVFDYTSIESLGRHLAEHYRSRIDRIHVLANKASRSTASAPAPLAKPTPAVAPKTDLETWFVDRDAVTGGLLVAMQTRTPGTPVFAVAGADGSVMSLQTLSRAMNGIRPMFGFQGVGLDGKCEPLDSVQAMAEANIAALAGLRDCSKLSLLGYSNGAVVAFEMAHQLMKQKIVVERLVLVDGRCPASSARSLSDEIAEAFSDLIRSFKGKGPLDADAFRKVPEEKRADSLFELIQRNGIWMTRKHFMLAYKLSLANEHACRAYRPKKLPKACETVVVRGTRSNGDQPPALGWDKFLAKPAACIDVDADHISIVGTEGSAVIARIFQ